MATEARYDSIGTNYSTQRLPEPTWQAEINAALSGSERIVNVGAGTGNYEPEGRFVIGVEPSRTMLDQRQSGTSVQGVAEALPFPDRSFDAALAILTVHHWADRASGLQEMARVAPRQVLFIFEPLMAHGHWITSYFDSMNATETNAPGIDDIAEHLNIVEVRTLWVPAVCRDGVAAAYWARPEKYLDPEVQASASYLAMMEPDVRNRGISKLGQDLESGRWDEKYGHLRSQDRADYGYRLAIAEN